MVEVFGGYAYIRFGQLGNAGYINGGAGAFGWNVRRWVQIVTDTSYSVANSATVKNILYGTHLGPRFFYRGRNRWGASPFAEALFGISNIETTVSGPSGYRISDRAFSMKVGAGLDLNLSSHFGIRLFDVDYYRTLLTGLPRDNYCGFAGVVLRFGGGRRQ